MMTDLQKNLHSFLQQHIQPHQHLLLALSGGLDSCVLLHLLTQLRTAFPFRLSAMHVHHGLSPHADSWADFCQQQCQKLQVPLQMASVHIAKDSGLGVEASARKLRYEALLQAPHDFVLTAHHQGDQAETLLLQLFRGAGVKGLAAMAPADVQKRLLRPLLDVSRQSLQDYAEQHGIVWCEDESNDNPHYTRNFVRHQVLPVLAQRFPAIQSTLARSASHMAEANDLLQALAQIDIAPLLRHDSICVQGLMRLDPSRIKNVLRYWLAQHQLTLPSSERLTEIIRQLCTAKSDAHLCIPLQHLILRRYQHRAYLCREQTVSSWNVVRTQEAQLTLPDGGMLYFKPTLGVGLAMRFAQDPLRVTTRRGGERLKPHPKRPTRTLKHWLQEAHIPPWQRGHVPLVYWQDTLACVPGVGVAESLQATANEMGLEITWQP